MHTKFRLLHSAERGHVQSKLFVGAGPVLTNGTSLQYVVHKRVKNRSEVPTHATIAKAFL